MLYSHLGFGRKSNVKSRRAMTEWLKPHRVGELATGIVCGCLPVIPPFFRHFVPIIASKLSSLTYTKRSSSGELQRLDHEASSKDSWPGLKQYVELPEKHNSRGHFATVRAKAENYSEGTSDSSLGYDDTVHLEKGLPQTPKSGAQWSERMEVSRR